MLATDDDDDDEVGDDDDDDDDDDWSSYASIMSAAVVRAGAAVPDAYCMSLAGACPPSLSSSLNALWVEAVAAALLFLFLLLLCSVANWVYVDVIYNTTIILFQIQMCRESQTTTTTTMNTMHAFACIQCVIL